MENLEETNPVDYFNGNPPVLCYRMISEVTDPDDGDVIVKAGEEVRVSVKPEVDDLYWAETIDKRVCILVSMDEVEEA